MSQSQVWKKRPAGLASEIRDKPRCWLNPKEADRLTMAAASSSKRRAGLKRRKY